ncbi:hypothetical protein BGZ61DRAFT_196381 [Ilyonectria robusta]|uniref:uncharacterized protein n=1 Tax=Ilyonectria robusta TaxID=1079257 RepID=UPI001E8D4C6B|nr:uncharacterized protein BGZ61DRAFT_196381 [Ilyonectria robusta]KAH8721895.1 hypothetical protein BGZ61DRAFT_196381 [Ilyonectria robusta]
MLVSPPIAELNKRLIETSSCPALPCPVCRAFCVGTASRGESSSPWQGLQGMGICRACKSRVQMDVVVAHAGGSDTASRGDPRRTLCVRILFTAPVRGFARQVLTKYTHLTRKASHVYECRSGQSAKVPTEHVLTWPYTGLQRAAAKDQKATNAAGHRDHKTRLCRGIPKEQLRRPPSCQAAKLPSHGAFLCWRLGALSA